MKEKVVLVRPNGETEEREVICYFKAMDDAYPNIKNVPVLVVDKKEQNNGNSVLEFFWEKDGLYHSIADDTAWGNVKAVIVDIIKSNFAGKIELLKAGNLQTSMENGRSLALNIDQMTRLIANYNDALKANVSTSVAESVAHVNSVEPVPSNAVEAPVTTPVMNESTVIDMNVTPVNEPVSEVCAPVISETSEVVSADAMNTPTVESAVIDIPVAPVETTEIGMTPPPVVETEVTPLADIFAAPPVMETPIAPETPVVTQSIEQAPLISKEGQVEIVSNPVEPSDFEKTIEEIQKINEEYDAKIIDLNKERQVKINATLENNKNNILVLENDAKALKERASEHLKNAQAAEKIATIAHQNAQNIQNRSSQMVA